MKRLALVTVIIAVLAGSISAGNKNESATALKIKRMSANLVVGINSHNEGLRKSSIYYAGKYKVAEAVEPLCAQLNNEKDPETRVLIALALYSIGSPEGIAAVKEHVKEDPDAGVRKICLQIYESYSMNDVKEYYTVSEKE